MAITHHPITSPDLLKKKIALLKKEVEIQKHLETLKKQSYKFLTYKQYKNDATR